jgi:precorrin-2 dehydrogenase/sirohydrochlorin ferrochelatase
MMEETRNSIEDGNGRKSGNAGHFPFLINLAGKEIVIVGGGDVAFHKAALLSPYADSITVYSETFCEDFDGLDVLKIKASGNDILKAIGNPFLVICATDDHEFNDTVMKYCAERGILCNNVDVTSSDVYFGSMIKGGPLTISISTNGMSPTMARFTKETIMNALNRSFWEMLDIQTELRSKLRHSIPEMSRRRELLCSIVYDPEIWLLLDQGRKSEAAELALRKVNSFDRQE